MTVITGHFQVRTQKFEIRLQIVDEGGFFPFGIIVARATFLAVMAIVLIIFQMAADTGWLHFIGIRVRGMAIGTGQQGVLAEQLKVGISRMVETCVFPVFRVMAGLAFGAVPAFMVVIGLVTPETSHRRIRKGRIRVTIQTSSLPVIAYQWVTGYVMIKIRLGISPFRGLVAVAAIRSE